MDRKEVQENPEYFGSILSSHLRGIGSAEIAQQVGSNAQKVDHDLHELRELLGNGTLESIDIFWSDLQIPTRMGWRLSAKGRALLARRDENAFNFEISEN